MNPHTGKNDGSSNSHKSEEGSRGRAEIRNGSLEHSRQHCFLKDDLVIDDVRDISEERKNEFRFCRGFLYFQLFVKQNHIFCLDHASNSLKRKSL